MPTDLNISFGCNYLIGVSLSTVYVNFVSIPSSESVIYMFMGVSSFRVFDLALLQQLSTYTT